MTKTRFFKPCCQSLKIKAISGNKRSRSGELTRKPRTNKNEKTMRKNVKSKKKPNATRRQRIERILKTKMKMK